MPCSSEHITYYGTNTSIRGLMIGNNRMEVYKLTIT